MTLKIYDLQFDSPFQIEELSDIQASQIKGGLSSSSSFEEALAQYKKANTELQEQNFLFKQSEGIVGLANRISQAKIG